MHLCVLNILQKTWERHYPLKFLRITDSHLTQLEHSVKVIDIMKDALLPCRLLSYRDKFLLHLFILLVLYRRQISENLLSLGHLHPESLIKLILSESPLRRLFFNSLLLLHPLSLSFRPLFLPPLLILLLSLKLFRLVLKLFDLSLNLPLLLDL